MGWIYFGRSKYHICLTRSKYTLIKLAIPNRVRSPAQRENKRLHFRVQELSGYVISLRKIVSYKKCKGYADKNLF